MKRIKSFFLALTILISAFSFTGCGSEASKPLALAVVVGAHSNFNQIPKNLKQIDELFYKVAETYRKSIAEEYVEQMGYVLFSEKGQAQKREVDTLRAIRLAANSIQDKDNSERLILVIDSGLSTVGELNFVEEGFQISAENIVADLEKKKAIPDLNGLSVEWLYCAETALPQPRLSELQKFVLQEVWEKILEAGDAENVKFHSQPPSSSPHEGLPPVSIVEREADEEEGGLYEKKHILENRIFLFKGDLAEFEEEQDSYETLVVLAEELQSNPESHVYVIGCTAGSPRKAFCKQLSEDRIHAVTDVLSQLGVSESQMLSYGLSSDNPWYVNDLDQNGKQIEEIAAPNRRVMVIDVDSGEAEKLLGYLP